MGTLDVGKREGEWGQERSGKGTRSQITSGQKLKKKR